jgi:hypothetical protein
MRGCVCECCVGCVVCVCEGVCKCVLGVLAVLRVYARVCVSVGCVVCVMRVCECVGCVVCRSVCR